MNMNDAQIAAFRAALYAETDPVLVEYRTTGATTMIQSYYNAEKSPAVVVWKTIVTQDEIMQNGFDWVQVDNLTAGKARIWDWLFNNQQRVINPSKPNVRGGIAECWKGTAALLAVQAVVLGHCKRNASRIESLYSTGTGTAETPASLVFVGPLNEQDVTRALSLQV